MLLNDKDARAVDWIMSQQPCAVGCSSASADVGIDASIVARGEQVQTILTLLDLLPKEQPPADLVRRTLARVGQARRAEVQPAEANQPDAPSV